MDLDTTVTIRPMSTMKRLAAGAALLALPGLALAHVGTDAGAHHGALAILAAGFVHPFTGADHLLAMLALGLWSATSARRLWTAPLAFVLMLLAGALLAQAGLALPAVEPMIAASLLVIGMLAATGQRLSTLAGVTVAGAFALFHGAAHGQEFGASGDGGLLMLTGMVVATALLHGTGLVAGRAMHARAPWLPRLAGGAVASVGALMLGALSLASLAA